VLGVGLQAASPSFAPYHTAADLNTVETRYVKYQY